MTVPDTSDLKALFERMSDPALVWDEGAGRVLASNNALAALTGHAAAAALTGAEVASFLRWDVEGEGEGEGASLLTGDGEGWARVSVERLPCAWEGRAATLCLLRRVGAGADTEGLEQERMSALFSYLQEATEQVEVVNRVVAAVNSSRTIDEVFSLASEQMRSLVPFDRASIALGDPAGERLRVFALSGANVGSLEVGAVGAMRGSVTELALTQRRMVVIPDLQAETRFNLYDDLRREGFQSAVCCPLFSTHNAVGSLNLTSRTPDAYKRKHLLALERLAPPLAIAIEKMLLLEQAERRSREMEAAARREELAGRIGRHLASSLDPSGVFQETVELLGRALEVERCHIVLLENEADEGAQVNCEYLVRPGVASLRGQTVPLRSSQYAQSVLEAESAVRVSDINVLERDELMEMYKRLDVCATLAAPLHVGGAQAGMLEVHDCSCTRVWTDEQEKLLCTVAGQVSVALTNAQLYEASRRRTEELRGLYEISRTFSTLTDTSEISGRLARAIAQLTGGAMCLIATYDRRNQVVHAETPGYNTPPGVIEEFHFRLDRDNQHAPVYQTGEPFFSNDPANDERFNRDFIERHQIRSVLSVPMRIKRELLGFIYVANRAGGFHERDLRLLEILATQAAETIVNARLFATIQAQAEREAVVNRLLLSLQRSGEPRDKIGAIIERLGQVLELDRCIAVLFADGEHEDFYGEWCAEDVSRITDWADVRERSPMRYALRTTRRPLIAEDVRTHALAAGLEDLIERTEIRSMMVVPIMHQGRVIGSISGHQTRRQRRWSEDDVDLLIAVATHVGSTLENARLIAELREANRLKDEFLATLSHELRTPLTAITGWVDLLKESKLMEADEELADGINAISAAGLSLTQLISDLLDLSRIQRGVLRLEREMFDLNLAIRNAVRTVRQTALARRQELQLELEENLPLTIVDAQRIQQVLWNLLTNAIKFTPEGGRVTVRSRLLDTGAPREDSAQSPDSPQSLDAALVLGDEGAAQTAESAAGRGDAGGVGEPRRARWIELEVEDTGEGISEDFLPFIWDRFRQADSSATRRHGGLGIGLALVKELVEAHGGQVDAASDGVGATFMVRLPVLDVEEWVENEPRAASTLREQQKRERLA